MRRMIRLLSGAVVGCAMLGALAIVPRAVPAADELKVGEEAPDFTLSGSVFHNRRAWQRRIYPLDQWGWQRNRWVGFFVHLGAGVEVWDRENPRDPPKNERRSHN